MPRGRCVLLCTFRAVPREKKCRRWRNTCGVVGADASFVDAWRARMTAQTHDAARAARSSRCERRGTDVADVDG
jgi:hypothetical protein